MTQREKTIVYNAMQYIELGVYKLACDALQRASKVAHYKLVLNGRFGEFYDKTGECWYEVFPSIDFKQERLMLLAFFAECEDRL